MRAQDIADEILSSERLANSRAFADRVYADEPILRTGAQVLKHNSARESSYHSARNAPRSGDRNVPRSSDRDSARNAPRSGDRDSARNAPRSGDRDSDRNAPRVLFKRQARTQAHTMPAEYRHMRALARGASNFERAYSYGANGSKIFYEQGKYMEDFEDDFEGNSELYRFCGTYEDLGDYDLRCYFTWRTRFRAGETTYAPLSFLYIYAHEILCGIGVEQGEKGLAELERLSQQYAGLSASFDSHLSRWKHDYVIYYGLSKSLIAPSREVSFPSRVSTLAKAQSFLLDNGMTEWPSTHAEGMPAAQDVLDSLCALSRYRADRSRFIRDHREDVAEVCCKVFARMVWHCHKRRKIDYIEGLFGGPVRTSYTMFPSAVFWTTEPHPDVEYEMDEAETYICDRGFWWRRVPCRRFDTSKELGALMHAIDARMRVAMGDAHTLKSRPLPKYQGKFVDEEIEALLERRKAEEVARIHIDRSSLVGIRSASVRTREALLTDEERTEDEPSLMPAAVAVPVQDSVVEDTAPSSVSEEQVQSMSGLDEKQASLLRSLLHGDELKEWNSMEVSLAVDAINEVFLDLLGDTVIEFDGDVPLLVEDYVQDVRDAMA